MNGQPPLSLHRPLGRTLVDAVRTVAKALLAHVRETVTGESAQDLHAVAGMSEHMLRDIGAAPSRHPRMGVRALEYPRL